MLKSDPIEMAAVHLITSLQSAFGQTMTYVEITRIYQEGLDYRPLAIQDQAIDFLCTLPQRPTAPRA